MFLFESKFIVELAAENITLLPPPYIFFQPQHDVNHEFSFQTTKM